MSFHVLFHFAANIPEQDRLSIRGNTFIFDCDCNPAIIIEEFDKLPKIRQNQYVVQMVKVRKSVNNEAKLDAAEGIEKKRRPKLFSSQYFVLVRRPNIPPGKASVCFRC